MRISPILLATLLLAGSAFASDKSIWACRTSNSAANPILHLVEWGDRSYVKFAHMRFGAHYAAGDGYQAWYWHNDGSGYYRYGLVLGSDDRAWYHDFRVTEGAEESIALDYFVCRPNESE